MWCFTDCGALDDTRLADDLDVHSAPGRVSRVKVLMVEDLRFIVKGLGLRVKDLGFGVKGSGLRVLSVG